MELRNYQKEAINACLKDLRSQKSSLLVAATGAGKTVMLCHIINEMLPVLNRVLVVQHRDHLTAQNKKTFDGLFNHETAVFNSTNRDWSQGRIVFAMVQSIDSWLKTNSWIPDFDFLVFDEAHHAMAPSYTNILRTLQKNPHLHLLGVTATPSRHDKKGMNEVFNEPSYIIRTGELVDAGFLTKPRIFAIPNNWDLEKDFIEEQTETDHISLNIEINRSILKEWKKFKGERQRFKTILFSSRVERAQELCTLFQNNGIISAHIDGSTNKAAREIIIDKFRNNDIELMTNVGCFTEGFDVTDIECVVIARTKPHHGLYQQMAGRGLRVHDGKSECFILDFGHASKLYDLLDVRVDMETPEKGDNPFEELIEKNETVPEKPFFSEEVKLKELIRKDSIYWVEVEFEDELYFIASSMDGEIKVITSKEEFPYLGGYMWARKSYKNSLYKQEVSKKQRYILNKYGVLNEIKNKYEAIIAIKFIKEYR